MPSSTPYTPGSHKGRFFGEEQPNPRPLLRGKGEPPLSAAGRVLKKWQISRKAAKNSAK